MLGNQSNGNGNKPVFRNARLFGPNCTTSASNSNSTPSEQTDFIEEDYNESVKNDVPEMKLLSMEYVGKVKTKPKCPPPPPPKKAFNPIKCKCPSPIKETKAPLKVTINAPESIVEKNNNEKSSDKYLVYKRKHSIFGTSKDTRSEKLKYVSDNKKSAVDAALHDVQKSAREGKKKYLIFDGKRSNSSKFETIQYYFDNKSYEKYVDNKLYGKLNQAQNSMPPTRDDSDSDIDTKGIENSRSWEYRDNAKTESKLKLFESRLGTRQRACTSEGSLSGSSSCSEVSLKRQNCRLKPQMKFTTSKSISDLSIQTNHDVKRINQLFANAKSNQENKEKYRVHRRVNEHNLSSTGVQLISDKGILRENAAKYHRSSTDLSIKSPLQSCGFKNCKLSNCPISHNLPSSSSSSSIPIHERRGKYDENFIKKFEDMKKNSNNCGLKNNEITVNRTNISVNGKSNIIVNDTKGNNFTPNRDVFIIDCSKEKSNNNNNANSNNNKTTIKINDSCFVVNHNNNNSSSTNDVKINNNEKNKNIIELNSEKTIAATNWDKNIKVKNNPANNKVINKIDVNDKIKNEENSVKIYVIGNDNASSTSSPTPSTALSSQDSSDSDKDDGYYDASSQGRSSSPEFAEMYRKLRDLCNTKKSQSKFGCDSTLFWNNSFFDEEESDLMLNTFSKNNAESRKSSSSSSTYACAKCHTTTEDLLSNYICICRNKVILSLFCKFLLSHCVQ
jgi:hypothetical protein